MKTERRLFIYLALFMIPLAAAYPIAGHFLSGVDLVGTVLLILLPVAFGFIGIYLWSQERKMGSRPSDDPNAQYKSDEVGQFPTSSIWPLVAAAGMSVAAIALIFSTYFFVIAIPLLLASVVGFAREGYVDPENHH